MCRDTSLVYLNQLGYNVIRHPREDIRPLELLGRYEKTIERLGRLKQLVKNSRKSQPIIQADIAATSIEGQHSGKLDLSSGLQILGGLIGAMGGSAGVTAHFGNFQKIQFVFNEVLADRVEPAAVGKFLDGAELDSTNGALSPYIDGDGRLFVVTEVIKTRLLSVNFDGNRNTGSKLDLPMIQQAASGRVEVSNEANQSVTIKFSGEKPLAFGFKCLEIGVYEGRIQLTPVRSPGAVYMGAGLNANTTDIAMTSDEGEKLLATGSEDLMLELITPATLASV